MAATNIHIRNKVRGDDIPIIRRYVDLPSGDSIVKARMTVKASTSVSSPEIFQLTITTSPQTAGLITKAVPPEIYLTFIIIKTNSLLLSASTLYYYDIQVDTAAGYTYTCEIGDIKLAEQLTQASG